MSLYSRKSSAAAAVAVAGAFAASLLGAAPSAYAAVITFNATGSGSDGALAAQAVFTTSAGHIQVVLSNELGADVIRSVGQSVSDLSFTLSNNAGAVGTTSASGQQGNISSAGLVTYVSGSPGRFIGVGGGNFTVSGADVTLEAIGGGQPDQLIFPFKANGATYGNTNPGITAHNPYTIGPGTFELDLAGVTAGTTITAATFSFGTGPDTFLTGDCTSGCFPPIRAPEPGSLAMLGGALIGFGLLRRRKWS